MCKKGTLGFRHVQVVLLFFSLVIGFGMRINMSMAIVAMTNKEYDEDAFDWDMQMQSVILSSFLWGYIILQIPSGEAASRYGGKILMMICMSANSVVSLLIPMIAYKGGWQGICFCRFIQGLTQGCLFPTLHWLMTKWVPLKEKSRLGSLIYGGSHFGTFLQLMVSGFIIHTWGWPGVFYVNGTLGTIWCLFYLFLGFNSPEECKMISKEEKSYIQTSLGQVGKQEILKTPWNKIFTSVPFLALLTVHCGHNWGYWTLVMEMPSYMDKVLNVDIKANGVMSALPYLALYMLSFPFGFISDYAIKKKWCSISSCRKICNSIGEFGPAIALIGLCYMPPGQVTLAVTILTIIIGLNAGHLTGFLLVHIDMAPNFAGTLMGVTNCFANIVGIIAPLIAGMLLQDEVRESALLYSVAMLSVFWARFSVTMMRRNILTHLKDPAQWHQVFYLSSAVYVVTNLTFIVFGTSNRQPWNEPEK